MVDPSMLVPLPNKHIRSQAFRHSLDSNLGFHHSLLDNSNLDFHHSLLDSLVFHLSLVVFNSLAFHHSPNPSRDSHHSPLHSLDSHHSLPGNLDSLQVRDLDKDFLSKISLSSRDFRLCLHSRNSRLNSPRPDFPHSLDQATHSNQVREVILNQFII